MSGVSAGEGKGARERGGLWARLRARVRGGADAGAGDAARMQIPQIAATLGLPEERVAQIAQMVKANGMDDAQMGSMMKMALEKGLARDQISGMLASFGVPREQVVRVMAAQGVMDAEEAELELARERARREASAATDAAARRRGWAKKAAIIVFWLGVWELVDRVVDNRLVLAGPVRVAEALAEQVVKPDFWMICGASFLRIAAGFLLAFSAGVLLALLSYRVRIVRDFVEPVISLLRTVPVISFIIMLLIWVGNQALTIYLAFLIVLPLIYTNMLTGFESTDRQMLEMARTFRLSPWRTFLYVYRPAFMPFLTSSAKMSLGMSWKSGIMAEVIATPKPSIGKEMSQARTYLDTPDLFAWTVVVMVLSLVLEKLFLALLRRAGRPCGRFLGVRDDAGGGDEDAGAGSVAGAPGADAGASGAAAVPAAGDPAAREAEGR